jgi:hypothetical protein
MSIYSVISITYDKMTVFSSELVVEEDVYYGMWFMALVG